MGLLIAGACLFHRCSVHNCNSATGLDDVAHRNLASITRPFLVCDTESDLHWVWFVRLATAAP